MDDLNPEFWRGKRVLITGASGFKGFWLSLFVRKLGARVFGLGLAPNKHHAPFFQALIDQKVFDEFRDIDITDLDACHDWFGDVQPNIIFHLAAQALVISGEEEPIETLTTNVIGSANVLHASEALAELILINVTTDKVYKNTDTKYAFKESDRKGGNNFYSVSKAAVELISDAFFPRFDKKNSIMINARAGNVLGGGDFSSNRIIPDLMKSVKNGKGFKVRNLNSIRPWQHVLDICRGYLMLAEQARSIRPEIARDGFNFGPGSHQGDVTVEQLVLAFSKCLKIDSGGFDRRAEGEVDVVENKYLSLDSSRSKEVLNWEPVLGFDDLVNYTSRWYRLWLENRSGSEILRASENQIEDFLDLLRKNDT